MTGISRRQLLAGAGQLTAAAGLGSQLGLLAGCARPARPRPDWDALARRLHGRLLRPGQPGYRAASTPWNLRYAAIRPAGVAMCERTADAVTALTWARDHGVPFAVRSGGHSYAGYSASHGLVISLARMNWVRVDARARTISLGPGARNRDLYAALAGTGLAAPSGRCPTVAISGLLLGGGFGFASRHFGLTCDHLLTTEVVTAAGQVLDVNRADHPDLLWACQGGGGGNFGINTGFTLSAVPVGRVSVYRLAWPWRHAAAALAAMLQIAATAPRTFSCRAGAGASGGGPATGGSATREVSALGLYFGPRSELAGLLAPALRVTPAQQQLTETSYTGAAALLARNVPFGAFASKSRFLARQLPGTGLDTLLRWVERWPGSSDPSGGGATIFAWGGAIGDVAPGATAFVHRDAAFLLDTETSWGGRDSAHVVAANLAWLEDIYHALAPYGTGQAYQNFTDPALRDWQAAYYGQNLARLGRIKRAYDPGNVFRFPQSVPEAS